MCLPTAILVNSLMIIMAADSLEYIQHNIHYKIVKRVC